MARCSNEAVLKKIGVETLKQNTEIDLRLRRDLPDCRKIDTKRYTATSAAVAPSYNKYRKPKNRFECGRTGCITTGTLLMGAADETVTYRAAFNATEWAAGVVTFYVYPDAALQDEDYPVTVTLKLSGKDTFADADVYKKQITKEQITDDGFAPVMVNLAGAPDSVMGDGWTPNETGAYVQLSADKKAGFSSISIYDSVDDFDLLETVSISCLTTAGGTFDLEVVQQQCQEARYNDQVTTLNFPVTGTRISPNYMNLFPMMGKGDATEGFDLVTIEQTISAAGRITLADANQDVCGYITVQADDACDVTEATYYQSSATSVTDVDEGHFIVVKNTDGSTDLVFNESQAGTKVLVKYPKRVEVEEWIANADNLNSNQVSMTVPRTLSDGTKFLLVFDNVYITSFPMTITSDDASFAFTLSIGRDADGNFFKMYKIVG